MDYSKNFRWLFDSINQAVGIFKVIRNESGEIVDYEALDINPKYEEMFHLKRSEFIGTKISDNYRPDSFFLFGKVQKIMKTKSPYSFERYFPFINLYLNVEIIPLDDEIFACVLLNITQRMKSQGKIKESRQFLEGVFNSIQDGISVLDADLNVIQTNSWMEKMYESNMPLVGKKCYSVYHNKDEPCKFCPSLRSIESKQKEIEIVPYRVEGNIEGWIELSAFPLLDKNGKVKQIIEYVKDISEQRRIQQKILDNEQKYRNLIEMVNIGLAVQMGKEIIFMNKKGLEILEAENIREINEIGIYNMILTETIDQMTIRNESIQRDQKNYQYLDEDVKTAMGNVKNLQISLHPIIYQSKPAIQVIFQDISDLKTTMNKLNQSEEKYRGLVENALIGVGVQVGMNFVYMNPWGLKLLEAEKMSQIDKYSIFRFIHEDYHEILHKYLDRILNYGESSGLFEIKCLTLNDRIIDCLVSSLPITYENQKAVQVIFQDITSMKKDREKLEETMEILEGIFDSTPNAIFIADLNKRFLDCNLTAMKMFEFETKDQIIGRYLFDFLPDEVKTQAEINLQKRFENSLEGFTRYNIKTNKGKNITAEVYSLVLKNKMGVPTRILVLIRDVTEQHKTQTALIESEEKYRSLFNSSPDSIFVTDLNGLVLDCNPAAQILFEAETYESLINVQMGDFIHKEDLATAKNHMKHIYRESSTFDKKYRVYSLKGNKLTVRVSASVLTNEENTPFGFVVIVRNITEEEKFQRSLLQTQKLESMGVLAGGIAHDFNNLMMAILGNADLALTEISPHSSIEEYLNNIIEGAKNASEVSRQMLAYSGKGSFKTESIDLTDLIQSMVSLIKVSISNKADLTLDLHENLPKIYGDASQIRQIIMNLLTNASEALENKPGVVRISTGVQYCDSNYFKMTYLSEELPEDEYVFLEVSDSGIGMDKNTMQRIFDPFFTTKFTGRGLGLAAVIGIVKAHGGTIKVYTEVGKGSIFKVLLPKHKSDKEEETALPEQEVDRNFDWGKSMTVLIVDDEPSVRKISSKIINSLNMNTITAENGLEAVNIVEEKHDDIDVILLDLTMPILDGNETFLEIKRRYPHLHIILTSGFTSQEISEDIVSKDYHFIQKPFSREELKKVFLEIFK